VWQSQLPLNLKAVALHLEGMELAGKKERQLAAACFKRDSQQGKEWKTRRTSDPPGQRERKKK